MPKPTKLQAAAAAEQDEKKTKKGLGLLASALSILGITPAPTAGKMKRVTETTKHVKTEEEEGGSESEESEEEEEESEEEGTESTGTESTEGGSESAGSEEEEEEEEGEEDAPPKKAKRSEEEEEKALGRAVSKALNSPEVHAAFLAVLPKRYRDEGALFSPHRLASAAKKATGQKTTFAAMHALSTGAKATRQADEGILRKQGALEARVAKVEGARRKDRVDAIVKVAKEAGRAGATTHDGREALRDFGMKHGSAALSKHLAKMPKVARTKEATPRGDHGTGAPSATDQMDAMRTAAVTGITDPKEKEAILAELDAKLAKMNGAAHGSVET